MTHNNTLSSSGSSAMLLAIILLPLLSSVHGESEHDGFTAELIRIDSPASPFFNSSETSFHHLSNSLQHSTRRAHHFNNIFFASSNTLQTPLVSAVGAYLMKLRIGTPPVEIMAAADTGSDAIWLQCKPCGHCNNAPLFDPTASSSFYHQPCSATNPCRDFLGTSYCRSSTGCAYASLYDSTIPTRGVVGLETLSFDVPSTGRTFSLQNATFGCAYFVDAEFDMKGSGVVGLGVGHHSLISQLKGVIQGRFSYCLVPMYSQLPSRFTFGSNSMLEGPSMVSTRFVTGENKLSQNYFLRLEAMSLGQVRVAYHGHALTSAGNHNIMIDSGTTLTYLPPDFLTELESHMMNMIYLERVQDPLRQLDLCYRTELDIDAPDITVHFTGADVKLTPLNTFIRTSDDTVCFAFARSSGFAFLGNVAQMNFLIGYDIQRNTVSFKPTDCTNHY